MAKAKGAGDIDLSSQTQSLPIRKATTADVLGGLFRPAKPQDKKGGEQIPKSGLVFQAYVVS